MEKQLRRAGDDGLAGLAELLPRTDANGLQTGIAGTATASELEPSGNAEQAQADDVPEKSEVVKSKNWTMNISKGAQLSFANDQLTLYVDSEQSASSQSASAADANDTADLKVTATEKERKEGEASTPAAGMAFKPDNVIDIDHFNHKSLSEADAQASDAAAIASAGDTRTEIAATASSDPAKTTQQLQDGENGSTPEMNVAKSASQAAVEKVIEVSSEKNEELSSTANSTHSQAPTEGNAGASVPNQQMTQVSENQPSVEHVTTEKPKVSDQTSDSTEVHSATGRSSETETAVMVAIKALQQQSQMNQEQIAALSTKLTQHLDASAEFERTHSKTVNKLSEILINLIVTKNELENTKKDLNDTNEALGKIREQVRQTHEEVLDRQKVQSESQQAFVTELQAKLQEAQKSIKALTDKYAESQEQTKILQDKVNNLRFENLQLQHQIEDSKMIQAE
ncbi:hypothetical protein [Lacticaseibacillus casei]|uniref:Uncharacterized protein n=1 Tax=Lacticaseibacillus casei TaxID=1582 RepID=A0ABZ0BZP6_LACCA|nr:hypothetical protein [Lacticaseibacillus casei]KAB1971443.1 hypothetical protein F9B82_02875 [Lacticaseibacillus casei]WNX24255.1 hypothetical protein RWA15_11515 [Lacticaseibacillus casei]WNX27029.1 hypothetical protein RWA16_11520 [Lacticaseibacillus casei]